MNKIPLTMKNRISIFAILLTTLFMSCKPADKENKTKPEPVQEENTTTPIGLIENAHHKAHFLSKKAIEFDITVLFGGNEHISGKIATFTNSSKAIITLTTGDKIYVNKDKVYHTPNIKNEQMVRFDAFTWSYFFLFPYKLSDEGTQWSKFEKATLNGEEKNSQFLTFESGTGDAPDDWYYVYSNPNTDLIDVAAYIVTFGKGKEKAEKEPHAVKYNNYQKVDGIPIATKWTYWGWNKEEGLTTQIGKATISNVKFIDNIDFNIPENFIEK